MSKRPDRREASAGTGAFSWLSLGCSSCCSDGNAASKLEFQGSVRATLVATGPERRFLPNGERCTRSEFIHIFGGDREWKEAQVFSQVFGEFIDQGSFGAVYKATWRGEPAAIKVARTEFHMASDAKAHLRKEFDILEQFAHPNIICVIAFVDTPTTAIVMELCEESLHHRLHIRHPVRAINQHWVLEEAARGLAYLHTKEYLHRDLKSPNVLLACNTGQAKLADFGFARLFDAGSSVQGVKGTMAYLAPELLGSPPAYSTKSDVYAFAVLAWEVASKSRPRTQAGIREDISKACFDEKDPLRRMIEHAWSLDPGGRPDAQHLANTLKEINLSLPVSILESSQGKIDVVATDVEWSTLECVIAQVCQVSWPNERDIIKTVGDVIKLAKAAKGGTGFVIASDRAYQHLQDQRVDFQVVDRDRRYPEGYMTQMLGELPVTHEDFERHIQDFSDHKLDDGDKWPAWHEASGLPKDGYVLLNTMGLRRRAAVRIVGLEMPPYRWENVGTRHLAGLATCWALRMHVALVVVRSDSNAIRVICPRLAEQDVHIWQAKATPALELTERPEVEIEDKAGARYRGQWRGDQRHGKGTLTRLDGQKYEGYFVDSQCHGWGRFVAANGNTYEGEWCQDRAHGEGEYTHVDGSIFKGQWAMDEKSGRGVESWADGARYEGEFLVGAKHGRGVYTSGAGVTFDGQFHQDRMDGLGRYSFADGRTYDGEWRGGHMHGHGCMEWPNGSKYEGAYERDIKSGEGTFTWPDGRVYRGQWRNGKQNGRGITVDSTGAVSHSEWLNGTRTGASTKTP